MSIADENTGAPPGPSGPVPRKPWHKRRWIRLTGAIVGGLFVIGVLTDHSGSGPAAATAPAKPAITAPAEPATPKALAPKATPKRVKADTAASAIPAQTTPAAATPARPTTQAPAQSPAPPAAATPAGCHPLSNEGTCYEPGEYCRNADHGISGIAGDGKAITCEYNNGWRWEQT